MQDTQNTQSLKVMDRSHHLHPFTDIKKYRETGGRIVSRAEHIYIFDSDRAVLELPLLNDVN